MSDSEVRLEPLRALDQDSREGDHEPGGDVVAEDEVALAQQLHPPDIYTRDRTYWADLPWFRKLLWVNRQSNAEACRELRVLGRMMARDPLSPVAAYLRTYALNGLGLFVEGYTLFSVGNLVPLFSAVWPDCWKTHQVCDTEWQNAVDYLMIVGIVVGQLVVGIEGDWIGRRFGMVQNALIMTLGSIMLTAMWGATLNGWVICYAWSLFIYGLGVGGEYPMTSTHAMESSAPNSSSSVGVADRMHRGRSVSLAFLMQGWGQFANQLVLILLLLAFSGPDPPYGAFAAQWVFRLQFGFVAVATLFLAYVRFYHVKYPEDDARRRRLLRRSAKEETDEEKTGVEEAETYDAKSLWLATTHYWHRVVGTAGTWFCNDFFFYGNKIFAGVFIGIITGGKSTLMVSWLYNLINIGVSLVGYYMAAILMDHKMYGRKWMQANGFAADFILFIIAAVLYDDLIQEGDGVKWFQFIYFFSSFWNQFGPNSTTFLLAAEVFPTSVRGTAHGVSAAVGKLGALAPAILYHYIDNHTKFWVVTWFGLAGWVLTMLFVPDTTGLDLREQERYWRFVAAGRAGDYHGVAVHPRHLSLWERIILRRHRAYDPALDREQRMVELCKAKVAREAHESSDCSSTCLDMSL